MNKVLLSMVVALGVMGMMSCGGGANTASNSGTAPAAATAPAATATTATASGEDIFKRTCVACHQANGMGIANTFPPLAKSDFIADREKTIEQVIKGKTGEITVNGTKYNNTMPPQPLNDDEIAAVLTYVYSNFGNTGAPVSAADVRAVRAKL